MYAHVDVIFYKEAANFSEAGSIKIGRPVMCVQLTLKKVMLSANGMYV